MGLNLKNLKTCFLIQNFSKFVGYETVKVSNNFPYVLKSFCTVINTLNKVQPFHVSVVPSPHDKTLQQ